MQIRKQPTCLSVNIVTVKFHILLINSLKANFGNGAFVWKFHQVLLVFDDI